MSLNIKDYDEICPLGSGGFANVYLVRHKSLGYIRALKVSKEPIIHGERDKEWIKFFKECRLLLQIGNGGHPNIVKIYHPRLENNQAMVEMDYIDGDTLHDYIEKVRFLPFQEVWKFIQQIVGAMAYCHVDVYKFLQNPQQDGLISDPKDGRKYIYPNIEKERELVEKYGVCHNDLHASNVMRRNLDGSYVLLDFGLAIQNHHAVNSSNARKGCTEYMAPEKYNQDPPTVKSDVYSLGVLLFKVLTGTVPFRLKEESPKGESDFWQAVLHNPVPDILSLRKKASGDITYVRDYPEEFDTIINKCLSKEPKNRYSNAKEILLALESAYNSYDPSKHLEDINVELSNQLTLAYDRISEQDASSIEQEKKISTLSSELESSRNEAQQIERDLKTNKSAVRKWKILSILIPIIFLALSIAFVTTGSKSSDNNSGRVAVVDSTISYLGNKEIIEKIVHDTIQVTKRDTVKITQKDTVKVKVPVIETKIEYRIPQNMQNELNQLRREISNLQTKVQNERARADRAVELARKK